MKFYLYITKSQQQVPQGAFLLSPQPVTAQPPLPEPGSAGGFFLLKGSFSFPLLPKCLLIGGHMIVGFFSVCIIVRSTVQYKYVDMLCTLWRPRPWPLGDLACKLTMFLSECCTFCTILHITFLSLERYLAVCWPITAKTVVTRRRTRAIIGCLWLSAAVSAAPVLVMVGVEDVGGEDLGGNKTDKRECRCTHFAISSGLLSAMMILSNLYFLVPLCILGLVYSLIGRTLWLRPKSSRRDQSHRNTVKMLGVIVLAFVLCWLPFHVVFSDTYSPPDTHLYFLYYLSQYFNLVSSVLFYLSAAVNPLLYNLMSARYRHAVCSLIHTQSHTQARRMHTLTVHHSTTTL
uniref:G-protein coupled receptors family 1 profile domain-containing protein n=1 Tax=Oreochromis niloticus TaxID=8128 RepID=A0A669DRU5_ORENI